jgi:DNA (cytosine-5)-methyltransferase 1
MIINRKLAAIDMFCGAGGLTHGLKLSGIPVMAGFDIDDACKYAYEENNQAKFVSKDIRQITASELLAFFPDDSEKIMVGCAPCQTFSTHTHKVSNRDKDQKWGLITEYLNKILEVQPSIVSMENVAGITKYPIFEDFVNSLKSNGYSVSYQIVFCPDYGISQSRRRLVLLASKYGEINLIKPTHNKDNYLKVKDVIGSLPPIKNGGVDKNDPLHFSASLSPLNKKRMRASRPGGSWMDWPESLRADCHKKDSGSSYKSVYARMQWDAIAPTITTQFYNFGTGRFGHPSQDRALSVREGALIQTFPATYKFSPEGLPVKKNSICRMIGNAVPVRLGQVIGESILQHLSVHQPMDN